MTRVLGLNNDALVYFVRFDLRPGGRRARGPGRGAGPRARGARAARRPRPPAAGPQPWTSRAGPRAGRQPRRPAPAASGLGGAPAERRRRKRLPRRLHLQPAGERPGAGRAGFPASSRAPAAGAWNWLIDPETQKVSFFTSLWNHPFFTISCITLIGLFFAGIHKRVVAPSIIAARCRTVLAEYNMSCDDTGKLILKPRPHVQ